MDLFHQHKRVRYFFSAYEHLLQEVIRHLWQHDFGEDKELCLLAVGGFGRREMYPFSDTDITIVCKHNPDEEKREKIAGFIQSLWDIGVYPAAKAGSVEDLCRSAREDLTGDTAFLDARFLCGEQSLASGFLQNISFQRDIVSFIEGKLLEQEQRHAKVYGSSSLLEPNIKTCPGGLRDMHTMLWLSKVQNLQASFTELVKQHILTSTEANLLMRSYNTLSALRMELHLIARRPEDRLLFDYQSKAAENMGFRDDEASTKGEKLMKQLYRATKAVKQLDGILLPMLKGRVSSSINRHTYPIDDDYYQVGNMIAARDLSLFERDKTQIFGILKYFESNRDIVGIAPKTLRRWWQASRTIDREFYRNPVNRRCFIDFFRQPQGLTHLLRFMNVYGILGKYLPNFGKIVGLLQHDLFHIYPVDDHILNVVRNMRRMATEEHSHELPLASSLMHDYPHKDILYLAAFFHDIAKGRGGKHEILGVEDARNFAVDHFLSENETGLLCWLVENHLLLSMTAQKEDIYDPAVMEQFCRIVDTREKLIGLYLLTIADVRGTNPAIWNNWKAGLFEHLFREALAYLQGNRTDKSVVLDERRAAAIGVMTAANIPRERQQKIWQMFGDAYFARHEQDEIRWHLEEIADRPETSCFAIRVNRDRMVRVMVYMPNGSRLFAGICQIFRRLGLDIVRARAYVTAHQFILDTFELYTPEDRDEDDLERSLNRLRQALDAFIHGRREELQPLALPQSRRSRHLPIIPKIAVIRDENDDKNETFILEIVTFDRRGLLANVAGILSDFGCGIIHARVNTLGERVEDSFVLHAPMLLDTNNQLALKQRLLHLVGA